MYQEDYLNRTILLAMLSVGDVIYHVSENCRNYNIKADKHDYLNIINTFIVTKAPFQTKHGLTIEIKNTFGLYNQQLSRIDEYEGKLYAWNKNGWYYDYEYEKRIERLIEIILSPYTIFK
jgi:hypothetical protein